MNTQAMLSSAEKLEHKYDRVGHEEDQNEDVWSSQN